MPTFTDWGIPFFYIQNIEIKRYASTEAYHSSLLTQIKVYYFLHTYNIFHEDVCNLHVYLMCVPYRCTKQVYLTGVHYGCTPQFLFLFFNNLLLNQVYQFFNAPNGCTLWVCPTDVLFIFDNLLLNQVFQFFVTPLSNNIFNVLKLHQ